MKEKISKYSFYVAMPEFLPDLNLVPGERHESFKERLKEMDSTNNSNNDSKMYNDLVIYNFN